MAESQKRKADDSATDASQFYFQTTYADDYPPDLLKQLDNPPNLSDETENMIYVVQQQEEEGPCNEQSFDTRAVFTSLSLANQQVLNIVREEHLEFFDGDDWSQFEKDDSGEVEEGMISWSISEIGELKLHCLPEYRECDNFQQHKVFVERHVIRSELLPGCYEEVLKGRKL